MAVAAYRQKYSTAGRDVELPKMNAKKFVKDVSGTRVERTKNVNSSTRVTVSFNERVGSGGEGV